MEVIHFHITTDRGCFKDMDEITSVNIVEYFASGGKRISTEAPEPGEYEAFFSKILEKYDEVIHVAITSKVSRSYEHASQIVDKFQGTVHIFDTEHLSTGIGFFVLKAVELVKENKSVEEIIDILTQMRKRVSTTFIAYNADYLYRAGKVSKFVKILCNGLKIHPVLQMKNGYMKLKTVKIGNYEKSSLRYLRSQLRNGFKIDSRRAFITHCSSSAKLISGIKSEVKKQCNFDEIIVAKASATVSSNCGPNAFGIIFVRDFF